ARPLSRRIAGHPHRSRAHRHTRRARPARPVVHARSRSPGRSAGCRQHRRRSERLRRERPPGAPDAARVGPFHRRPPPRASDARGVPRRPAARRAEALLSAGEDESEGRRRAIALNNMLFSSALTRRAIEGAEPWRHELLLVDPVDGSDLLFELLSTVTVDPREGTGIVSILRNVTDLRRATQEIEENYRKLRLAEADARAERDRLDLIIDSVADPILVTDSNANIV